MNVDDFLSRLECYSVSGTGWMGLCPGHDDHTPSLSISIGADGRILLHCHAGCEPDAICAALGLNLSDLFSNNEDNTLNRAPSPPKPTPTCFDWQVARLFD